MSKHIDDVHVSLFGDDHAELIRLRQEVRDLRLKLALSARFDEVQKRQDQIEMADRMSDAAALGHIAEMGCPADIKEFGVRHKIPAFAEATWQAGFIQGWRARGRAIQFA